MVWNFDVVQTMVERYEVEYVVFMPKLWEVWSEKVQLFDRLAAGDHPSWLMPVLREPEVVLFGVMEPVENGSQLLHDKT